ncbi:MAG: ZIP family metal transporter [Candidatus Komeilibacteria bacterium]
MLTTWTYTLISIIIVSLVSLVGVLTIFTNKQRLCQFITPMVGLATGALFGGAFIHMIPQAFISTSNPTLISFLILTGLAIFFILEKFLHWHHHHHHHEAKDHIKPFGYLNLISDGIHNLIDGIIIGVAYLAGIEIGIAATVAVILHEIPQEIGDFGLLLHAGFSKAKALLFNFLSACMAIIGAIIALTIGSGIENLTVYALAIAAGGFVYIAGSDLVPELHQETKFRNIIIQFFTIGLGVGLMFLLVLFE